MMILGIESVIAREKGIGNPISLFLVNARDTQFIGKTKLTILIIIGIGRDEMKKPKLMKIVTFGLLRKEKIND